MRIESILISLIALILGSFLILSGLIAFCSAAFHLSILDDLCQIMQTHAWGCGLILLTFGGVLLGLCAYACRLGYLHVEMGDYSLNGSVIGHLAQQRLTPLFDNQECQCEVVIYNTKQVEFFVDLPFVAPSLQTRKLQEIEKTLTQLLKQQAQFKQTFVLHANFKDR